jgi:hypothetical protein
LTDQPSKSGLFASAALHAALLAAIVVGFAEAPKFDDASESFPVETVTQEQLNKIMKGDRAGTLAKTPVEQPAPKPVEATAPTPAPEPPKIAPPELKHVDDPGPDAAPAPPPRPAAEAPPPTPPQREAAVPTTPDDAEPDRPKPKIDPKPAPPARPKVDKPPERPRPDDVAKFLDKVKTDEEQKAQSRPKSGSATIDPPRTAFDPSAIAKLIDQGKPSPTRQLASLTPLGSQSQNAQRMSPSLSASLDGWLQDAYLSCWTPPPAMPPGEKYVALIHVAYNSDGSLSAPPQLVNPPADPAWRAYAESSMRAVLKCNPLRVPPQYVPYYEEWRTKTVHFDPESAQG